MMICECCGGSGKERILGYENTEIVQPCSLCQQITIHAEPSRAAALDFASRALRNAPDGTVTKGLLEALCNDLKDGLKCLDINNKQ